jgi:ATP-independent RNA helicase DbpA
MSSPAICHHRCMTEFSSLPLTPPLLQALDALGYASMTPIQAGSLPPILAGRDVIAQARTGSGKTAAFGLGLLSRLDPALIRPQGLVLCPTRELADQVSNELRRLARFVPNVKVLTLCGGIPLRPQLASLQHEPHLVVGTPGRIVELLGKDALKLDALKVLVLDEADRMLDMGFEEDISAVIATTPSARQTLLFSATYPEEIRQVSRKVQREPVDVTVDTEHSEVQIEQQFVEVDATSKRDALVALLAEHRPESALVFCNTKRITKELADDLQQLGHSVLALHGDLDQREREEVLVQFANRSCAVLIATDVAARGLDIKELPVVISYELATDPDVHVHRVGRTGRAGQSGLALALCAPSEVGRVSAIETRRGAKLRWVKWSRAQRKPAPPAPAPMLTLCVDGGRVQKVRAGDVLGALTGAAGMAADAVGKIDVFPTRTYVAIKREQANTALSRLRTGKIKGRTFRVRKL